MSMFKFAFHGVGLTVLLAASNTALAHHVEGTVYCDANENGRIDKQIDTPIELIRLTATREDVGDSFSDHTNENGYYNISLPSGYYGNYEAMIDDLSLPEGSTILLPEQNPTTFPISKNSYVYELDWLIDSSSCQSSEPKKAALGNYVWYDVNENGKQNRVEPPAQGVEVSLYGCGEDDVSGTNDDEYLETTVTDSDGHYLFVDLTPNNHYFIKVTLPDGYLFTGKDKIRNNRKDSDVNSEGITKCTYLSEGERDLRWDAGLIEELPEPASIGDKVWYDQNQDGLQNNSEIGADGINVDLYACGADGLSGTGDDILIDSTLTDGLGTYLFSELTPNSYFVKVTQPTDYLFTAENQGGNDARDSDVNESGVATCTTLEPGENDLTWDAGLYMPAKTCDLDLSVATTPSTITISESPDCDSLGKPTKLTFQYTGGGCAASNNAATNGGHKAPTCHGAINDTRQVFVSASGKKGYYSVSPNLVAPGDTFTVSASKFDAWSEFSLGNNNQNEVHTIHTSCSAPLEVGDVFGSLTLIAFNDVEATNTDASVSYTVTNHGDDLSDLVLTSSPFGHSISIDTLPQGASDTYTFTEAVSSSAVINAVFTGTLSDGQTCSASDNATIEVKKITNPNKGSKGSKGKGSKGKGSKGKGSKGKGSKGKGSKGKGSKGKGSKGKK